MYTHRRHRRKTASRRRGSRRSLSFAGGGSNYAENTLGPLNTQMQNVNVTHAGAPTGGAIWSLNGQSSAYIQPSNQIPFTGSLMAGGGRRRRGRGSHRRGRKHSKKCCKSSSSWFPKLF